MVFVGFAFLIAWLRKYSYSAIGFNFLIAAVSFQWALLWGGFFDWAENGQRAKVILSLSLLCFLT